MKAAAEGSEDPESEFTVLRNNPDLPHLTQASLADAETPLVDKKVQNRLFILGELII